MIGTRGQTEIDQNRCDSCRLSLEVCPQGAIVLRIPVYSEKLGLRVGSLR